MDNECTYCRVGPIAVAWVPVSGDATPAYQEELLDAPGPRRGEFAAARRAAHGALRRGGLPDGPIRRDASGAPRWPAGTAGALAHTARLGAAAVAPECWAVGLDVEDPARVRPPLARAILTEPEQARYNRLGAVESARFLALAFSAKEAYFKLQFPICGDRLCFPGVELTDWDRHRFELATALGPVPGVHWLDPATGLQFVLAWIPRQCEI